jgi:hypothetical protein
MKQEELVHMNPYVFIVGCPRSGTTVLQRVVDAHPQLAIIAQSRWIPGFLKMVCRRSPDGFVTPQMIPRLLNYRGLFRKMGIGREQLEQLFANGPLTFSRFVSAIFDLYGAARGKALVGDKTPIYVRNIRLLHEQWPEARFIHLIRDGRDVCLSTINWKRQREWLTKAFSTWRDDAVTTAAMRWRWNVRLGREAGVPLGPELYYELRYEAFVHEPAEACAKLCAFLGVPYDERVLRFYEGRTKNDPTLDAKKGWRPITPGLRDWRTQMPDDAVERFEAAAGDLLDELGYARGVRNPPAEALQYAAKVEKQFVDELRARKKLLPAKW